MNIDTNTVNGVTGQDSLTVLSISQKNVCQNHEPSYELNNKNIIFLFDNSASMYYTLSSVKKSILTFRDLFCGRISASQPSVTKEMMSETMKNFSLYTFSEKVRKVWGEETEKDFDTVVNLIEPEGSTNMGAAIETAFEECDPEKANWIVLFTDGVSNKGNQQTLSAFNELVKKMPINTKLITLGYGTDFNVEILNSIGDFTFLETTEDITTLMGALAHEISTCSVFKVELDIVDAVFGENKISSLSNDRKYYVGLENAVEKPIAVTYTLINGGVQTITDNIVIIDIPADKSTTDKIKNAFYNYKASKMIKKLMLLKNKKDDYKRKYKKYTIKLENWTDECAAESRETVLRVAKNMDDINAAVCAANTLSTQYSYVDDKFVTPSSLKMIKNARDLCGTY